MADRVTEVVNLHSKELKEKQKELSRRLKLSSGSFIITCGLGIASMFFPPLSFLAIGSAAISILLGGKSAKDIINDALSGNKRIKELKTRPVSILAEVAQVK